MHEEPDMITTLLEINLVIFFFFPGLRISLYFWGGS